MESIAAEFGEDKSLYDVLEISSGATPAEIKKAYFKIALKCHPDKCPGDEAAKGRFQALSLVHSVLSDPERRILYDETGEVGQDGEDASTEDRDLWCDRQPSVTIMLRSQAAIILENNLFDVFLNASYRSPDPLNSIVTRVPFVDNRFDYWRNLFPKVTVSEIEAFGEKYKGSEEETRDVLKAYENCDGKMSAIIDSVMLATEADEGRFTTVIDLAIQRGEVSACASFRTQAKPSSSKSRAKRKAKMEKEAAEAEKLVAILKGRHVEKRSAAALSTHRAREFDSMISSMEERYGGESASRDSRKKQGKRAKKASPPDIDDKEFEEIQKKLINGRAKR